MTPTTPQWRSLRDDPPGPWVKIVHVIRLQNGVWKSQGIYLAEHPLSPTLQDGMWADDTPPPFPTPPDPAEEAFRKVWQLLKADDSDDSMKWRRCAGYLVHTTAARELVLAGWNARGKAV